MLLEETERKTGCFRAFDSHGNFYTIEEFTTFVRWTEEDGEHIGEKLTRLQTEDGRHVWCQGDGRFEIVHASGRTRVIVSPLKD